MTADSVPVEEPVAPRRRRIRARLVVTIVLMISITIGGLTIPTPYLLYSPGSARDVEPRIDVHGHEAFPTESGQILFLTVSEVEARPFTLIRAWLDDTIDVLRKDEVYPTGGRRRDRIINQQKMDDSKFVATSVALRAVGYPVVELGTGAFVEAVDEGSPADGKIRQGDVIVEIDGEEITTRDQASKALRANPPGTEVTIAVRTPEGERRDGIVVELAAREDDPTQGLLGVVLSTAERDLQLPFPIDIESGRVTGPSAGLAFALGVIDRLTPGDLAGDRVVAVTGTIDESGEVGPVGGVPQKAVAAMDAGATVMIYPEETRPEQVRRLREMVGNRMQLIPVATIEEALEALAPDGIPRAPELDREGR